MKKNGFIATSILYAFFLIFVTLFIALVLNFIHNKVLIDTINEDARETLSVINEVKLSDLKTGDRIRFDFSSEARNYMNDQENWIVAYSTTEVIDGVNKKVVYVLSDSNTQKQSFPVKLDHDIGERMHVANIGIMDELIGWKQRQDGTTIPARTAYTNPLKATDTGVDFNITYPTMTVIENIKKNPNNVEEYTIDNVLDAGGEYIILADKTIGGYEEGVKYNYRKYRFDYGVADDALYKSYCGVTPAVYDSNGAENHPGIFYSDEIDANHNKHFKDFCYYANPSAIPYKHYMKDGVIDMDETRSDKVTDLNSSLYTFRLMGKLILPANENKTYVTAGLGTYASPYVFTTGVKVA